MSDKIPTAEEQADKMLYNLNRKWLNGDPEWENKNPTTEGLVEFARLHLKAALTAFHTQHQLPKEDLEFTLSAYPETLIV